MSTEVKNFQKEVIEKSKQIPVLVDFWAPWCGPCRTLGPILENVAEKNKDKFVLAKLNTDENQEIAGEYGIRGIPAVKLFSNGQVIDEFVGALPQNMVEDWLKKALPSEFDIEIKSAQELFEEGKNKEALKILEKVYAKEPQNEEVRLLLGKILLLEDKDKAVKLIENLDGSPKHYEQVESINTIATLFGREENNELPAGEVKSKYQSAIKDLKERKFGSALEKFIEVLKCDRNYVEDGARKACIAIFKYLGEENKITLQYRREFSNSLYI